MCCKGVAKQRVHNGQTHATHSRYHFLAQISNFRPVCTLCYLIVGLKKTSSLKYILKVYFNSSSVLSSFN